MRWRTAEPPSFGCVSSAVARTVPRSFGIVPMDDAAGVTTNRGKTEQGAGGITIHGDLTSVSTDDAASSRCNFVIAQFRSAGKSIDREPLDNVQILRDYFLSGSHKREPARVQNLFEGMTLAADDAGDERGGDRAPGQS